MFSRVRIKMCGMTRAEDISYAVSLGVDAIGVICYVNSPRFVAVNDAKELLKDLPPFVDAVAVFVNPPVSDVLRVLAELPIASLQFHGEESPDFCEQFGRPYIKALPAVSAEFISKALHTYSTAQAILLDTPSEAVRGGSGKVFDWRLMPMGLPKPLIVAGGLSPENVLDAVSLCEPYAVDVCSGVEASKGIKDKEKMNRFVQVLWGNYEK